MFLFPVLREIQFFFLCKQDVESYCHVEYYNTLFKWYLYEDLNVKIFLKRNQRFVLQQDNSLQL